MILIKYIKNNYLFMCVCVCVSVENLTLYYSEKKNRYFLALQEDYNLVCSNRSRISTDFDFKFFKLFRL